MRRDSSSAALATSAGTADSPAPSHNRTSSVPIRSLRPRETFREHGENHEHVTMLAQSPERLPPIVVHRKTMRVIDGMHRLLAAELRGDRVVDVVFFDGDEEDAFVTAIASNARHGMPLSLAERAAAATRILRSRPQWPDRVIARATGLAPSAVSAIRRRAGVADAHSNVVVPLSRRSEFGAPEPPVGPVQQVAKEFGLDPGAVLDVLNQLRGERRDAGPERLVVVPKPEPAHSPTGSDLDRLCDDLFRPLARSDQRVRARQYLRGLLSTPGRKTIRNIAAFIDEPGVDQRLHHFISDSTWDWEPVRAALTEHVLGALAPEAWVVRAVMIPRTGQQAAGVSRWFCPARRKAVHGQQAIGVLAASETACTPVSWRLRIPKEWLADERRRARAALPEDLDVETLGDSTARALLHVLAASDGTDRPALLDARDLDVAQLLRPLRAAGMPLLVRVPTNLPLHVSDPAFADHRGRGPFTAQQIVEAARFRRRPVPGPDAGTARARLVTAVDVRWPIPQVGADAPLRLLAVSPPGEHGDDELWLTTLTSTPTAAVVRLTGLTRRADRDLELMSEQVGIWDFSGRSFPGWHRHVTLASVAHVVRVLLDTGHRPGLRFHSGKGAC